LYSAGFANDAPEQFVDSAIVERAGVEVPQTPQHVLLAIGIAKRQVFGLLQRADFEREPRPDVQKPQQFSVNLVDLLAPMLYIHHDYSDLWKQKNQPRLFQDRGWLVEGVVLAF
jgi:hypothetical protein